MSASSTISITRATSLSPDVYNYALAAYNLLFAPRALDPAAIPADLRNFEEVYCTTPAGPSAEGCFLIARDSSLPTSNSPSSPNSADQGSIVGILAYRPYIHRHLNAAGVLTPELVWPGEKTVEVVRLFVSPECRGQRLAQRLIHAMEEEAVKDEVKVLYLHTQPFLTGAEELWAKMGWTLIQRDTDHWESIHMYKKVVA